MSKRDEIITAIRKIAERLGRAPSQAEFRKESAISWHQVYKHFRGMRAAVRAAGLEPGPRGGPLDENALVLDWAKLLRLSRSSNSGYAMTRAASSSSRKESLRSSISWGCRGGSGSDTSIGISSSPCTSPGTVDVLSKSPSA
jgi:hypothetical protein